MPSFAADAAVIAVIFADSCQQKSRCRRTQKKACRDARSGYFFAIALQRRRFRFDCHFHAAAGIFHAAVIFAIIERRSSILAISSIAISMPSSRYGITSPFTPRLQPPLLAPRCSLLCLIISAFIIRFCRRSLYTPPMSLPLMPFQIDFRH
jgi:hypothetical protein